MVLPDLRRPAYPSTQQANVALISTLLEKDGFARTKAQLLVELESRNEELLRKLSDRLTKLLRKSDKALYMAKDRGRNRVVL